MKKRIFPIVLSVVFLLSVCFPMAATAADSTGSITILFRHGGAPIEGAEFSLYNVAELDAAGAVITRAGAFDDYSVLPPLDAGSDEWRRAALTLAAYVLRDDLPSDASGSTDSSGSLNFYDLTPGLFLLIGESFTVDDTFYIPQPMLVSVPYNDSPDGGIEFRVVVEPKYEIRTITGSPLKRHVEKIWADNGFEDLRPSEITVQLLCDGEVYDEQTLSPATGWSHDWEGLAENHDWLVVEETVPDGYTVEFDQEGARFTLTNTYGEEISSSEDSSGSEESDSSEETSEPDESDSSEFIESSDDESSGVSYDDSSQPDDSSKPDDEDLPQTGMLWWPVPVLLLAGFALLCAGIVLRFRKKEQSDD